MISFSIRMESDGEVVRRQVMVLRRERMVVVMMLEVDEKLWKHVWKEIMWSM